MEEKSETSKKGWNEKDWEEWGEQFGRRMEEKFSHCNWKHKPRFGVGGLIAGLFILAWGITWLGNDLGFWQFDFPFWPVVIILIALAILFSEIRKLF